MTKLTETQIRETIASLRASDHHKAIMLDRALKGDNGTLVILHAKLNQRGQFSKALSAG